MEDLGATDVMVDVESGEVKLNAPDEINMEHIKAEIDEIGFEIV